MAVLPVGGRCWEQGGGGGELLTYYCGKFWLLLRLRLATPALETSYTDIRDSVERVRTRALGSPTVCNRVCDSL